MQAPVSFEYPITAPIQYPANRPPQLPQVEVFPEVQGYIVPIAAFIATEAGLISGQSIPSMFCYNMLASMNWNNQNYTEIFKLVCDTLAVQYRSGMIQSIDGSIVELVKTVLTLYRSNLALSYPEVMQALDDQTYASCQSNLVHYQGLLADIAQLYAQPNQGGYHHRPGSIGRGNLGGGQQLGQRQIPRLGAAPVSNPAASGVYQGNTPAQSRPLRGGPAPAQPNVVAATPQANLTTQVDGNKFIVGEIEKMDRKQHSVAYFGRSYELPVSALRRKMEESVEEHEALAVAEVEVSSPVVSDVWIAEASFDEMIAVTRVKKAIEAKEGLRIYQSFGVVVSPIISPISMTKLFTVLSKATTFADIARLINEHVDAITDKTELRLTLSYVSQIDRALTKILNEFLSNMIVVEKPVVVTSFTEDVPELQKYLSDKFKTRYNAAYIDYQKRVINTLFKHGKSVDDQVSRVTDYVDEGTEVFVDNISVMYAVTYVTATAAELGYSVGKQAKRLTTTSSPMLHRLLSAVQKYEQRRIVPSHHVLVTSDDVRYQLFKLYGEEDVFTMVEC